MLRGSLSPSQSSLRRDASCTKTVLSQSILSLVERHTRYFTGNLSHAQAHLHGSNASITLSIERPEGFVSYREVLLKMGNMLLTMGCVDSRHGYELGFLSGDEYLITIPIQGHGWASTGDFFVEYGEDDIMIVAPSCRVNKRWDGPGQVLSLHVSADRFDAARAKLDLSLQPVPPIFKVGRRQLRSFLRVVDMICRDIEDGPAPSPLLSEPLAEQLEDILLTLLLNNLPGEQRVQHDAAGLSPAVPYYVRRAESFISANAHRDIGIEEIAEATGVSLRSIQYGFRRYRNSTPMLALKRTRYGRAREILLSDHGARRRICDIAAEIGCANVSQFSRDYRAIFGESPSETLATQRRLLV